MDKVKISKSQAEAIMFLTSHYPEANIVVDHAKNNSDWKHEAIGLNGMDMDLLVRALYYGFEIQEEPRDKVKELYDYFGQPFVQYAGKDIQNKIQIILTTLGFKIEGVNT